MSQAHDSRRSRNFLSPNPFSFYPSRIFRKRSSNSSIRSNRNGLQMTNTNRGHTTPEIRIMQSEDNLEERPGPRGNTAHTSIWFPPTTTYSPESPGHSGNATPRSSAQDLTRETSTRSLVSTPDHQRQNEDSSSPHPDALGVSESNPSPLIIDGHGVVSHEIEPEIIAPLHEARQPARQIPVYPIWPSKIPRYDNKTTFINPQTIQYDIKSGRKDYSRPKTVEDSDWERLIHPDGLPYFYHKKMHVITDAYIVHDNIRAEVDKIIAEIEEHINTEADIDTNAYTGQQRVLAFQNIGGIEYPYYYFVDHEHQNIFWFEDVVGDELVKDLVIDGDLSEEQFGLRISSEYWIHRWLYPGLQPVTTDDVAQVRDAIHSAMSDTVFSSVSTSPFPYEDLEKIENIMDKRIKIHPSLQLSQRGECSDPILERFIGYTLHSFLNRRFLDFYGEKLSRLSADQHLHPGSHAHNTSSAIMLVLTYLLFFSPRTHLKKLREVYVDFVVVQHSWKKYLEKLNEDWEAILILASVVLAVVVSFLAMPSVDTTQGPPVSADRSPIQLLGYASVILNIGSIIIVLMLKSLFYKSKSQGQTITEKATTALRAANDSRFGLEGLAIVFSLPRVLLIWAIILYAGAFFTLCFRQTTLVTRMLSGVPTAIITGICAWSLWMLRVTEIKGFTSKVTEPIMAIARRCRRKI